MLAELKDEHEKALESHMSRLAKATRAYRVQALGELRAMSRLRACESEAFVARLIVALCGRRGVERPWEPVRAVIGHGDGVGMVKS